MIRQRRAEQSETALSQRIGDPHNAQRFTVNLSADVGAELAELAARHRVSESSIVEIALRHLFRRVSAPALGAFLRDRGACLRRHANGVAARR
jgi:hypothetical protein